ncbi:MAG: hypothetical protein KIT58_17255 [Planctomycetota bacterium]|nr:hypothetical protein [Planctomycetota bacterium]
MRPARPARGLALLVVLLCGCPAPAGPATQQVQPAVRAHPEADAPWGLIGDRAPVLGRAAAEDDEVEVGVTLHAPDAAQVRGALFRVRSGQDVDDALAASPVARSEGAQVDGRWRVVFPVRPADGLEWVVVVDAEDDRGRTERVVMGTWAYTSP